jgi:4-hydroxybenzoate polyprenyltransferase
MSTLHFSMLQAVRLIRPKQWIKNGFVFASLVFARELFDLPLLLLTLRAFAAFCCAASAVYIVNDFADLDSDRAHPEKKHRPLAAGTISPPHALAVLALLLAAAVLIAAGMDSRFQIILGTYFVINLAYSWRLRQVFLLDVFIIAAGCMLRVAKRRGELVQTEQSGKNAKRRTLLVYRVDFVDQLLTVAAAGTVISYALYTVAPRTIEVFGTDRLIYTTVFVMYGVFRYMYLVHTSSSVENPTGALTSDLPIIINAFLWIAVCIFLIYFGGSFPGLSR